MRRVRELDSPAERLPQHARQRSPAPDSPGRRFLPQRLSAVARPTSVRSLDCGSRRTRLQAACPRSFTGEPPLPTLRRARQPSLSDWREMNSEGGACISCLGRPYDLAEPKLAMACDTPEVAAGLWRGQSPHEPDPHYFNTAVPNVAAASALHVGHDMQVDGHSEGDATVARGARSTALWGRSAQAELSHSESLAVGGGP